MDVLVVPETLVTVHKCVSPVPEVPLNEILLPKQALPEAKVGGVGGVNCWMFSDPMVALHPPATTVARTEYVPAVVMLGKDSELPVPVKVVPVVVLLSNNV